MKGRCYISHVATIDLAINDLDALGAACKRLGMELRRDQQTYKWWGSSVGDYEVPEGVTVEDLGKCDHALSVVGNDRAYEIGVCRSRGQSNSKWTLLYDFFQGGYGLVEKVGQDCCRLKQAYATEVAIKQAKKQGFMVHEFAQQDGTVRLRCTK